MQLRLFNGTAMRWCGRLPWLMLISVIILFVGFEQVPSCAQERTLGNRQSPPHKVIRQEGNRFVLIGSGVSVKDLALIPKNVQDLSLRHTRLPDHDLEKLCRLKLQRLDLSYSNISDSAMSALKCQKELKYLNLAFTRVRGTNIGELKMMPDLEELDCSWCQLSDRALVGLEKLTQLKVLNLGGPFLTDKTLTALRAALPHTSIGIRLAPTPLLSPLRHR